jgi:hypothetical protein
MAFEELIASVKNDVPFWWDWRLEHLVDRRKNRHDQSAPAHERSH